MRYDLKFRGSSEIYPFKTIFSFSNELLYSAVRVNSIHISSSDFYTAWDVIAKHVLDYREDTILAHR